MGTSTPGTTGSTRRDGIDLAWAIATDAVPLGSLSPKAQIGWSPLGAENVTRMRDPAR